MINFTKKYVERSYNKIVSMAHRSLDSGNYDQSLRHIETAARIAYSFNSLYSDGRLEALLKSIQGDIVKDLDPKVASSKNRYLFFDSFGWDNRGLTQQYIRALRSWNIDFLFIFENRDPGQSKQIYHELTKFSNVEIYELDRQLTPCERVRSIIDKVSEYSPSKAFLHLSPWATEALCAFYAFPEIEKYQINLTDHAFWLGAGCIDFNIEFREYGCNVSLQKRGIRKDQILLQPYYPILGTEEFEGLPAAVDRKKTIILSGGAFYKIYGENNTFFSILSRLLDENRECIILFAGGGDDFHMRLFIKKNDYQDRIFLLGHRSDINELFKICDIYLGTYPFCGGLMSQYAAVNSKPILAYTDPALSTNFIEGIVCHNSSLQITHTNIDMFHNEARKLIQDKAYRIEKGEFIQKCVISSDDFNLQLFNLVATNKNSRTYNKMVIDYSRFSKMYLEVENKYLDTFQKLIISKFKFSALYLFPRIVMKLAITKFCRYFSKFAGVR